jgi:hypothetical protein
MNTELSVTDRFDQVASDIFRVDICAGDACNFLPASSPVSSFEVIENGEVPTTCDGNAEHTLSYYKECVYTISCEEGSPAISFGDDGNWRHTYSSEKFTIPKGEKYYCNYDGNNWVVEKVTSSNGISMLPGCMNFGRKVVAGSKLTCE